MEVGRQPVMTAAANERHNRSYSCELLPMGDSPCSFYRMMLLPREGWRDQSQRSTRAGVNYHDACGVGLGFER